MRFSILPGTIELLCKFRSSAVNSRGKYSEILNQTWFPRIGSDAFKYWHIFKANCKKINALPGFLTVARTHAGIYTTTLLDKGYKTNE